MQLLHFTTFAASTSARIPLIINPTSPPFIFYYPPFSQETNTQRKFIYILKILLFPHPPPSLSLLSLQLSLATGKAMGFLKLIFTIAITMALSITLTMKIITTKEETTPTFVHNDFPSQQQQPLPLPHHEKNPLLPSKRVNRFLSQMNRNPNAADHCMKDHDVCSVVGSTNSTCCNNKCIDVGYDKHNCGACKNKCRFTETCCRGQCVDTNFDKRHCGECNHRCERGEYCIYAMCNYA
ncbi:hypothetical protein VNO77_43058 [Canavalia gladiata]|uniref:Uncharacterized protein n=1 Tax=Canavalia gladiata TaxID=3824 RepID=A0AAN9JVT5_CANGL